MTHASRARVLTGLLVLATLAPLMAQGGGGRGAQAPGGGRVAGPGRGGDPAGRGGPIRDNVGQATLGSASISGVVIVEGAGTPVRRARVSLAGQELRGGRSVTTDDQGRFTFTSLPAGRFTMTASKAGFVDNAYGAKRAGRPGTAIQLAESQKLDRIQINLPRGGVITGVVVDEHGEPAAGTQVRALRYVLRTGERTLQQSGQDTADDRGVYRIFQLQPGEYIVNALPRNMTSGDVRQALSSEISAVMQQLQTSAAGGNGPGGGFDPAALAALAGAAAGRGGVLASRLTELQQQLAAAEQEQTVAYAPVYFPGTTEASGAASVTLGVGDERSGIDFRLQLVATSRVSGVVAAPPGTLPTGTQVALVQADRGSMPSIPGFTSNVTRTGADGRFTFGNVTPGRYQVQARTTIRQPGPTEASVPGGRGRGGAQGPVAEILWAMTPVEVGGQAPPEIVLNLQPGMTVSGRVVFPQGVGEAPDPTRVRVSLSNRGAQAFELGASLAPVQADETGRFSIIGVAPGRYSISATVSAGGGRGIDGARAQGPGGRAAGAGPAGGATGTTWTLESAMVDGRDVIDFPIDIGPNQNLSNVQVSFTNRRQDLSGTIQDASGRPMTDFTIIVFPSDSRFWLPQARRIVSARPGTDGRFTFASLPPGDYRLAAVTDVEPGEWYDPAFLNQLNAAAIPLALAPGERKVQDIRLATQSQ